MHFLCNACFDWLLRNGNSQIDGRKQINDVASLWRHNMESKQKKNVSIFVENDRILNGGA